MAKINKDRIILYLLELISQDDQEYVKKTVNYFKIANSTVYNYIHELKENNIIKKDNSLKCRHSLVSSWNVFTYSPIDNLEEDIIFDKDIKPLLSNIRANVLLAWRHAFTEMMNNAIEHSCADKIICYVERNFVFTRIGIIDNGIGIFKNIQNFMRKEFNKNIELSECVSLLFAGKFTTAKENHSGEGIFFTSHIMDEFYIYSDNKIFSRNNFCDNFMDLYIDHKQLDKFIVPSTTVIMSLSNNSKKTTREIFDRFSDVQGGFYKTHIPISHIFTNGFPVSRSEARRLCALITDFKEVTLDFSNVEEVGQAFVHEIFIVWKNRNPELIITITNANKNVQSLITRVQNS